MKFTRENLIKVWHALTVLSTEKTSAKGAYAIAKNKRLAETEVKSIEDAQKNQKEPEGLIDFENARINLCNELCDKDEETGAPVLNGKNFSMSENAEEFNKRLTELRFEHKEALDAQEKIIKDFEDFVKEEVEIAFHEIKVDQLPDSVTAEQIGALGDIVVE